MIRKRERERDPPKTEAAVFYNIMLELTNHHSAIFSPSHRPTLYNVERDYIGCEYQKVGVMGGPHQ